MDVRHLRYFIAVAEELHFGRAARRLHMSRPPLSKRISDLEEELGVELFTRTSRSVELTPQGQKLLPHAMEVLRAFDATLEAMALPAEVDQTLRIGLTSETSPEVLRTLQNRFAAQNVNLDWSEAYTADQHQALLGGSLDIGVLSLPIDGQGLWMSPPLWKSLGVAVSPDHSLAGDKPIPLSALQGQTLLMFSRRIAPQMYDHIIATCIENGFRPDNIKQGNQRAPALMVESVLSSGHAITFIPKSDLSRLGNVTWRPIEGEPLVYEMAVCCRRGEERSALMQTAIHAVHSAFQEHDDWHSGTR